MRGTWRAGGWAYVAAALAFGTPPAVRAGDAEEPPRNVLLRVLSGRESPNRWVACKFYLRNAGPVPFRAERFRAVFFDSDGKPAADVAEAWVGGMDVGKAMPGCGVPMPAMEAFMRDLDEERRRAPGAGEVPPVAAGPAGVPRAGAPAVPAPAPPRKAGSGAVVIGTGEWSPPLWAGAALDPPRDLGPGPSAEVAAFDADGAFLGQARNVLLSPPPGKRLAIPPAAAPAPPPGAFEVYKVEPDTKSQCLAVRFVFQNRSPKPFPIGAVHCRYYGLNAVQPLLGVKVLAYPADVFRQGGDLAGGDALAAGSLVVAPDSAVCLVVNSRVRNQNLPEAPENVTAVELEMTEQGGDAVKSERIVLDRLRAKAAPANPATPAAAPPKPPANPVPATPRKGDDDDDDDDG